MDDMTKAEFETLKDLLVKYRNQTAEKYPDDKDGIENISRMIRVVNQEIRSKSIFPIITKEKQTLYEEILSGNSDLQNAIPELCGYYGRACRCMNAEADRVLCRGCSLAVFVSTVDAIVETCNEKEAIGIKNLYDSDIYDIEKKLEKKCIHVDFTYIEKVLDNLTKNSD